MIDSKIMETTKSILKDFGNTYFSDKGTLKRNKVIEDLDAYTPMLMKALLANQLIHDTYTESIVIDDKSVELFKLNQFIEMFTYKEYWQDSYTKFENKIGLTADGKFIDETADVVLDFPFKDTVLKAGMTKEDQKDTDEPFLHETIAKAEIDQLLEPKVFVNATKYNQENLDGTSVDNFDDDNLIIKGNNLIALHSLKNTYSGRVKLIYLDPPYNTGKDFGYHDNFNHSAWLTFIKSRLEIAWELLSDNGTIWISIDDNESHYIKVLSDSIFGRQNFINEIVWQRAYAPVNLKKTFSRSHDYIEVYAKNNSSEKELNQLPRSAESDNRYKNPDNDPRGLWKTSDFSVGPAIQKNVYEIITPSGRKVLPPDGYSWRFSKERYKELLDDNRVYFGKDGNSKPAYKRFLSEVKNGVVAQTLWTYGEVGHNQEAKKEIKMLFDGNSAFGTPKPERLLQRILTIGSNESDIVLDFFMGSATTQSVAMKMNRRFIGIEQMDYIKTVSVERLKKVIAGEQGGISKDVNWQGGGSFVYAELMEKNQGYLKDVQQAETTKQLEDVVNRMIEGGADFDFRVDVEKVLQDPEYQAMALADKKQLIVKLIDKNQLYYAYSDMDDRNVQELMSESDIAFNKSFYGERDL
ncbi:DNA methyltransferase [Bombilactobacillus thymidiniphilus]|uniref:Site-specific DNA-methyltransferase n=1 Tax=Bombilactobacillus thymidiniphilus TaxID=2923363 RepID=A0ABY4PFD1_9LACO|nr:DNA methyltransferase [Bombilactobacillus thymidiniphilus]UQS84353.1 site-specific DNA-methyltransferase [Bombilactobacillus thymidiniphilus]